MKKVLLIAAILMLMVSMVSAQSFYYVSPSAYTSVEANSNNTYPFYSKPFTYMQIHDDLLNRPMLISHIAIRGKASYSGKAAFQPTVDLWISTATCKSSLASATFANNHGLDKAQVITNTKLNFPVTPTGPGPVPFTHKMPFAKAFVYKGAVSGSLAWEVHVTSTTSTGGTPMDACSSSSSYTRSGTGGIAAGKTSPCYNYGYINMDTAIPGNKKLYTYAYQLPNSAAYTLMIGFNNTNFGPMRLPFDLSYLGGKGNKLYMAPIFMLTGTTSTSGSINTYSTGYFSFPPIPGYEALTFFTQVAAIDAGNTVFPMVLTDLCALKSPVSNPVCRIYNSSSSSATTGNLGTNYGLVCQFEYK